MDLERKGRTLLRMSNTAANASNITTLKHKKVLYNVNLNDL